MSFLIRMILLAVFIMFPLIVQAEENTINLVKIFGSADQAVGEKLIREVYKRAGIEITITSMPSKRALLESSEGTKDGETMRIWSVGEKFPTLKRVPTPLSSIQTQAFGKKGHTFILKNRNDLAKYDVVIARGAQHTTDITRGLENVQEISKMVLIMDFLLEERAEIALTGRLNGLALLKKNGITDIVTVGEPLKELLLYHYLHKDNEHLIPKIDSIIKQMVDSGEMIELREKYEIEYLGSLEVKTTK